MTDATRHAPAVGVEVELYNSTGALIAGGGTDSNGTYSIVGLPAGTYKVGFSIEANIFCGPPLNYVPQYYNNESSLATAAPVSVAAGSTTSGINAALVASNGPSQTLAVTVAGTGAGRVTSTPAGISCPGTCSANFATGRRR